MPTGKGIVRDGDDVGMGQQEGDVGYLQILTCDQENLIGRVKVFQLNSDIPVNSGDIVEFDLGLLRANGNSHGRPFDVKVATISSKLYDINS